MDYFAVTARLNFSRGLFITELGTFGREGCQSQHAQRANPVVELVALHTHTSAFASFYLLASTPWVLSVAIGTLSRRILGVSFLWSAVQHGQWKDEAEQGTGASISLKMLLAKIDSTSSFSTLANISLYRIFKSPGSQRTSSASHLPTKCSPPLSFPTYRTGQILSFQLRLAALCVNSSSISISLSPRIYYVSATCGGVARFAILVAK